MGALSHIRVLDLSRVLAGPWATQMLADLGAEVIKIERPGRGDDTRSWGPPYLGEGEGRRSAYFLSANRGKRSVAIDIARPEGRDLVRRLAAESDVLVENFRTGALARYGLDYDSLVGECPGLIYCSITGFGQTGPYASRAGYDLLIQALGGLMSVTGEPDARPGGGPMKVGVALADVLTGLYATIGIQAALTHRDRTGEGQYLDLALMDSAVASLANQALNYLVSGRPPERMGNAHPNIVPYQAFAAADGHLVLAVGNDDQFRRFCGIAGRAEWAGDRRFSTNEARVRHRDELIPEIASVIVRRRRADWLAELERVGVPCGPINDMEEVFGDPQARHRGLAFTLGDGDLDIPQVANPIRLSSTPPTYHRPPPRLGADTEAVLRGVLHLDDDAIGALRQRGVFGE
ncbi:MAG TPA: CaiB/BaiF CoA-transferase family protein [Gammaproteobacteria bacterium]|nr:CaiB/BaiF CoA-transferase family protein [Gammaproteobacteria bacterium]